MGRKHNDDGRQAHSGRVFNHRCEIDFPAGQLHNFQRCGEGWLPLAIDPLAHGMVTNPELGGQSGHGPFAAFDVFFERHAPDYVPTVGACQDSAGCPQLRKRKIPPVGINHGMGNRIAELRTARGIDQSELAALAGTTRSQLGKLERGERRLSDHWAERLAPHLGVSPYELFMPAHHGVDAVRSVPLVGAITCGDWREAVEHAEGVVPAIAGGPNVFALRADGDSMDMLIQPGGYVYVDPDDRDLLDGKVYAVMNGNYETTAKRYKANPARLVPCSTNPDHRALTIGGDSFTVIGRIVGTYSPL